MKRNFYEKPTMRVIVLQPQMSLMQFGHSGYGAGSQGFSDGGLGGRSGYLVKYMMQKNGLKGQQIIAQGIALGNIEAFQGIHTHNFTNLFF